MVNQFNLPPNASDQLREATQQVNLKLRQGKISELDAQRLIDDARSTEGMSRYLGLPLEQGSAQTLEVEKRRGSLMRAAFRRFGRKK